MLAQRRIPGTSLSVFVREIGRDEPLVSYNASVPRNPASTMKVVTTFAALELLGPAYTWRTRAYAAGLVRDQVLDGHLVLEGGGDPFMNADRWWGFVNGLRQVGIERIAGDVVIDNTLFSPQGDDRAAFDNRPYRTYNVLPDALMVNFQTVNVTVVPDAAAGAVRARVNPWPANLTVENSDPARARTVPARCRWRRRGDARGIRRKRLDRGRALRVGLWTDVGHACGDAGAGLRLRHVQDLLAAVGRNAERRPAPGARTGGCETALHARVADARRR